MKLDRFQIETMRGVLRQYWQGAGHSTEAPDALCDMALETLQPEAVEWKEVPYDETEFSSEPREGDIFWHSSTSFTIKTQGRLWRIDLPPLPQQEKPI